MTLRLAGVASPLPFAVEFSRGLLTPPSLGGEDAPRADISEECVHSVRKVIAARIHKEAQAESLIVKYAHDAWALLEAWRDGEESGVRNFFKERFEAEPQEAAYLLRFAIHVPDDHEKLNETLEGYREVYERLVSILGCEI